MQVQQFIIKDLTGEAWKGLIEKFSVEHFF